MGTRQSTFVWLGVITLIFVAVGYATLWSFQLVHPAPASDPAEFATRVRHGIWKSLGVEGAIYLATCSLAVWLTRRR
jgi:hypothetical protein